MWRLLKSVCAIFFFAVPHKGLRTTELQQMTSERSEGSKTKLLSDLEKDSETLRQMAETLATLSLDIHFVSVYEEQQTSSVAKVSGSWMELAVWSSLIIDTNLGSGIWDVELNRHAEDYGRGEFCCSLPSQ
jgi:hypothetical protein